MVQAVPYQAVALFHFSPVEQLVKDCVCSPPGMRNHCTKDGTQIRSLEEEQKNQELCDQDSQNVGQSFVAQCWEKMCLLPKSMHAQPQA